MLYLPGFYFVKKPKRFVILSSDKSSERNLSSFFLHKKKTQEDRAFTEWRTLLLRSVFQKCAQFLSALFIIFVNLTMTLFSENVLISTRSISSLMPNLIKKSLTDSKVQSQAFIYDNMYRTPKYTNLTMWYEYPLSFFDNTGCPKVKCAFLIGSDRWKNASQMFWYPEMIYFWALQLIFVKML